MQECLQPGASVSSVAISHGINANVIRKWLALYRDKAVAPLPAFVPLHPKPKRHADEAVVIALPLVCDDFAGYKAGFEQGITEIGCMAHALRKFFDLHMANKSQLAEQALHSLGGLYEVEGRPRT